MALIAACIAVSWFILPGCGGKGSSSSGNRTSGVIPFESLFATGSMSSPRTNDPTLFVLTNQEEYAQVTGAPEQPDKTPPVDFASSVVIGVGMTLPHPGYSFSVKSITQDGSEVTVRMELIQPDPDKYYPMVVVYEQRMLLVERGSFNPRGELRFVLVDEDDNRRAEVTASV
jgi:hypothetical protein